MLRLTMMMLVAGLTIGTARAEITLEQALKDDVVLRALVDENQRSMADLHLEGLEKPYFIEYGLLDGESAYVSAAYGAVTYRGHTHDRSLRTDVRVGSYALDNTNFGGAGGGSFGGGSPMPIEDDYAAIRQSIWWTTDRDYKNVAEQLVKKQAFMESKLITDKPPDFAHADPVVHFDAPITMDVPLPAMEELALALSATFRAYPDLQDANVTVTGGRGNRYLVNTEGSRLRTIGERYVVTIDVEAQADDGLPLGDSLTITAEHWNELPPREELLQRCRKLAEQLLAVRQAPRFADSYTGPVLFDAPAAAGLFAEHFAENFAGGQRPVGSRTEADDFANKLNRRILPRYLSVVDDPTLKEYAGERLMGDYEYDAEGVPAQAVKLVEEGRLKALLMSRNPSKEFAQSNGHARNPMYPRPGVGNLLVTANPALGAAELKQELFDACADEGLEYGIRVANLGGSGAYPLVIYKVYPDGREELVRGGEFAEISLKAFKRMLAAGDTPHVLNEAGRSGGQSVAAPALLFEELDLAKIDRDLDKPPILPNPFAR